MPDMDRDELCGRFDAPVLMRQLKIKDYPARTLAKRVAQHFQKTPPHARAAYNLPIGPGQHGGSAIYRDPGRHISANLDQSQDQHRQTRMARYCFGQTHRSIGNLSWRSISADDGESDYRQR